MNFITNPITKSFVGFDNLFDEFERLSSFKEQSYPAYNIEKLSDSDYKITLINSDYCMNYTIDRPKLAELMIDKYNLFVTYTPDIYPGVKVYYYWNPTYKSNKGICKCESKCEDKKKKDLDENSCKRITIAIFQSGKVIITGSNRMRQTKDAYNTLNKIIMNNYNDIRRITIES